MSSSTGHSEARVAPRGYSNGRIKEYHPVYETNWKVSACVKDHRNSSNVRSGNDMNIAVLSRARCGSLVCF